MSRRISSRSLCSVSLAFTLVLLLLPGRLTLGQVQNRGLTVADLFDIVNVNAADLSDDGRWLVATATTLRDRLGVDKYRFGDPTYVAPSLAEVWIIDTETAEVRKPFGTTKRQVRSLRWSPNAEYLGMLVMKGDSWQSAVWERATGKLRDVNVTRGKQVADNSYLQWSPR